ncbi:proteasome adapter and scaffold protein ECM29-like isoform X2 [Lineus longissimus]|uniref:proteasome adapter and scaffold protein ECM29-like isoform X2 n=1 Tax=Lineus longissimus TaxID=88925 RepID=UPI002B4E36FF
MAAPDELGLLERVFLRIGSAESDEQLENELARFLTPVLLKLSSQQKGVREKVMELLVHINKRVKSRPKLQLPIDALLEQYLDPQSSPFITNFNILYIKLGYPRLDPAKQAELVPSLISCLETKPTPQQDCLMQLMIPVLKHVQIPKDEKERNAKFGLVDKPKAYELMLSFMLDYLLLPYNLIAPSQGSTSAPPPPGLSEQAYKRVVGETPPSPEQLEQSKLGILKFLGAEVFREEDIVCHYVIALSDTRHSIATTADLELKKIIGTFDVEKPAFVQKLYRIFQGSVQVKGQKVANPTQVRTQANTRIRLKIFPYFLKSREATNVFPACIQVIFDCLYGTNTNQKLKHMTVQFVHHVCFNATDAKFNSVAPVLLSGMMKLVGEAKDDNKLRGLAYMAVGKIIKRVPRLVADDVALLQTLFDALSNEEADTRLAVQETLSLIATAIEGKVTGNNLSFLEALVMQNVEKPEAQARLMAVQFAKSVFPSSHIPSRYLLLLACGDSKEEVYTEAKKGLRLQPLSDKALILGEDAPKALPPFKDIIEYILEKANQRLKTTKKYVSGNNVSPFNPGTFAETLSYLRMCLAYNAGVRPDQEAEDNNPQDQAPAISKFVQQLMEESPGETGPVQTYVKLIQQHLTAMGGSGAMYCLLEIVAVAKVFMATRFTSKMDWIKTFMFSSREDMREYASQLYAIIIAVAVDDATFVKHIGELIKNLKDKPLECQHGSLLALGYSVIQKVQCQRQASGDVVMEDMEAAQGPVKLNDAIFEAVKAIGENVSKSNSHSLLSTGAMTALGEIGRCMALPLPNGEEADSTGSAATKYSLVKCLIDIVQSTKQNNRVREKASLTLGYLCVGEANFCHRRKVIEGLLDCAQPNQLELHFTVGEALVYCALGPFSAMARDLWTEEEKDFQPLVKDPKEELEWLVDLLLKKYIVHVNPHIRQAACIWLVALVKRCGTRPPVQARLQEIQPAFMSMLSESNEMSQDVASKGLGVVYENCTKEQKDGLVSVLVNTLMSGKRPQTQVTGETKLFQEGSLGKTPEGSNLSTYKELCAIASDLNQPDLIYKFMHLANHNAVWNSKKGAAYGFSTIAAQAGEQLSPYLHQIVPKLYRYQFDPNPRIQQAMSSIWDSLVTDSKKTVDKYLKKILDDLRVNLTNNQWRVRESSCLALSDLFRGRQLDEVVDQFPELWDTCFRVRDDIKESVRLAAESALKALSRVSIKMCDLNYGKVGEEAISMVLPCLLKSGLMSQVKEVRIVSLTTILKISKNAGRLLKPHIPLLVAALLESLSGLEPQVLNYLSLHVGSDQNTQDKLDSARIAASKTSPMMETINLCVQYVDDGVLAELVPRLIELIRSGIGVGTKAGCASFVISLVQQCPKDVAPYAGKLMSALLAGLGDRNTSTRKAYASALAYIAKTAKDSSVEKLITKLKGWYLEKEEESAKKSCGYALNAMSRHAPDILKRHASLALPLAFLAMHEKVPEDADTNSTSEKNTVWMEVWLDSTPGTEAGIRLYLQEIVAITQIAIESQSWPTKAQAARAMNTIAEKSGNNLLQPHLNVLLLALISGLSGRTWDGKEALLHAVATVCKKCKTTILEREANQDYVTVETVLDAVYKECKKERIPYKMAATESFSNILEEFEIDRFKELFELLQPMLGKKKSDDDEDIEKTVKLQFHERSMESLGRAWPKIPHTQDQYFVDFNKLVVLMLSSTWKVQVATLKATCKVWDRLLMSKEKQNALPDVCSCVIPALCQCLADPKYTSVRTETVSVVDKIIEKLTEFDVIKSVPEDTISKLYDSLDSMLKTGEPGIADRINVTKAKILSCRDIEMKDVK